MRRVILSYNQNNALARRKLAMLIKLGLFVQLTNASEEESIEMDDHCKEMETFMTASKRSMSHIIACYL